MKIDLYSLITGSIIGIICVVLLTFGMPFSTVPAAAFLSIVSIVMIFQASFSLYWMLYSWEDTQIISNTIPPIVPPSQSFTAIIPARHESMVIGDTIRAVSAIDYPKELTEILVVCRADDGETIRAAETAINTINDKTIRLVIFHDEPINKPHALNIGLREAQNSHVVIFDAEDQPHHEIYSIVNSVFTTENADVVQSGVQLMNYRSSWFSTLNVLEYFFWFKSTLHFFAKVGAVPLGGNTVFFKKELLKKIGGWDEESLTEDADIGIRLSTAGARIRIIYNEHHVTREETPPDLAGFIKQRTRWNQGFIQILNKGDWIKFPKLSQKFLAGYMLLLPELQSVLFLLVPVSIYMAFTMKLPVFVTILSIFPIFILFIQLVVQTVGLYEFTKNYGFAYPWWMPLKLFLTFYPYQLMLSVSAFRAILRMLFGNIGWEKTLHVNAHRRTERISVFPNVQPLQSY